MNSQPSLASVLLSLLDLSRLGIAADATTLAGRLGLSLARVERALAELERRGLVDAARVRPTLAGLALAASLDLERSARLFGLEPDEAAANGAPRRARAA